MPKELADTIESRKTEGFTMSFDSDGYKYIAVGYGTQSTGGYSIRADEVYEEDSRIVVHTTLIGPSAGEAVNRKETYPYIVIKIEYRDKEIEFTV